MAYDRVLVLAGGAVGEYDTPAVLLGLRPATGDGAGDGLTGSRGLFAAMVAETGPATAAALTDMARAAAEEREAAAAAAAGGRRNETSARTGSVSSV